MGGSPQSQIGACPHHCRVGWCDAVLAYFAESIQSILKIFNKVTEVSFALLNAHPGSHRCRHFSFILHGSRIIKIGFNRSKTHPRNLLYSYKNRNGQAMADQIGIHSEMDAVIKLGYSDCAGLSIINTRINRRNELDMSMPCGGCQDMLQSLNFKNIFYMDSHKQFKRI